MLVRRRVGRGLEIAAGVHVELAGEQLGRRRVADGDEDAVGLQLAARAPVLRLLQPDMGDGERVPRRR